MIGSDVKVRPLRRGTRQWWTRDSRFAFVRAGGFDPCWYVYMGDDDEAINNGSGVTTLRDAVSWLERELASGRLDEHLAEAFGSSDGPTSAAVDRVIEVLAPGGVPIFEWGHETTPEPGEIRVLAEQIVKAVGANLLGRNE